MPKVLYIAAWGRSGTTLLDNILDACPHVFSAGEMFYLWRRGLKQKRRCGCGVPFPECPLWTKIRSVAFGRDEPRPREVLALQARFARARHATRRGEPKDPDEKRYRAIMARLYQAIAEVTRAQLVVDSSKSPAGAALLSELDGVEPYLVHMVRDPRAVAHSWNRAKAGLDRQTESLMRQHGAWKSSVQWVARNALIERVARTYGHRQQRVRYEDFMAEPLATVRSLLTLAGVAADCDTFTDNHVVELGVNHTISGNPSRFRTGQVQLRPDDLWRADQSNRDRAVATSVALPLLHRYGYQVRVKSAQQERAVAPESSAPPREWRIPAQPQLGQPAARQTPGGDQPD